MANYYSYKYWNSSKASYFKRIKSDFFQKNKKDQTIIDIGCGGGHLVEEISMCVGSNGKIIGVDPSEFQIKTAKERCKHLSNVEFLCSNANDIDIQNNSCDAVEYLPLHKPLSI